MTTQMENSILCNMSQKNREPATQDGVPCAIWTKHVFTGTDIFLEIFQLWNHNQYCFLKRIHSIS